MTAGRQETPRGPDPRKVVCLAQSTLSLDDTAEIMEALCERFPDMTLPAKDDIRYATQNRQRVVKSMLIQQVSDLDPAAFEGVRRVGVTSGVSTPEILVPPELTGAKART